MILAISAAYIHGLRTGFRLAGRSLFRRFFLALFLWALLMGTGIAFAAWAAEHYFLIVSGQTIQKVVVEKWTGWWRVHPKEDRSLRDGGTRMVGEFSPETRRYIEARRAEGVLR